MQFVTCIYFYDIPVALSAYVNKTCDMRLGTSASFGSRERYLKPIVTQVSVFTLRPGNLDIDESTSRESTAGSASDRKGRRNVHAGSSLQCKLLRCPYNPRVHMARINICTHVKNPNTGNHAIGWTHKNTTHTYRNG